MALSPHLSPLLINKITKEPYLRLPYPHTNIILTPPRMTDAEAIVPILNDERVYKWLEGPPFPYLVEHARQWLEGTTKRGEHILRELEEQPGKPAGGCPVRILRQVNENGDEIFLGDCGIDRYGWPEISDEGERERLTKENHAKIAGDPDIIWDIGDYLNPSHHSKGIMTAAVKLIIDKWMVPRMGAKKIKSTVFKGNTGSVKVFEKNGFFIQKTLENWKEIPESKGGGRIGLHILYHEL